MKEMLKLRREEEYVFVYGRYGMLEGSGIPGEVFAYTMANSAGDKKALVLLSFLRILCQPR